MISILVLMSTQVDHVDLACVSLPSLVKNETYLQHNFLGEIKTHTLLDCAASCQSHYGCFSFGFEPRKKLCHLHNAHGSCAPDNLISKSQWVHGDLSALHGELWGPCTHLQCNIGQKCITNRATKKGLCVKGDLALPERLCPEGQTPGNSTTHTCKHGFLDAEFSVSSSTTTCPPDFTWTLPDVICSGLFVRMERTAGHIFDIYVENLSRKTFEDVTAGTSSLVFFYRGCAYCVVTLCKAYGESFHKCYVIIIGRNSADNIQIREPENRVVSIHYEDGVVSCTEFRPFWISWRDGTIVVGKGNIVGRQEFTRFQPDSLFQINSIGLSAYKNNNGTWLLYKQKCSC